MKPIPDQEAAARMTPFYRGCRVLVRSLAAGLLQWKIYHSERVPQRGAVILAANHVSFADPPLIGAAIDRAINFLGRESLFESPWFARLIRALNAFPVDRDGGGPGGVRTVLSRLEAGAAVLLFPEGTRSPDGQMQPARQGMGFLVLRTTAPVVPIRVFGLYEAWGRHRRWPRLHPIVIKFGEPMHFLAQRQEAETASKPRIKELYQEISDEIMLAMSRLEPCADVSTFPPSEPGTGIAGRQSHH